MGDADAKNGVKKTFIDFLHFLRKHVLDLSLHYVEWGLL